MMCNSDRSRSLFVLLAVAVCVTTNLGANASAGADPGKRLREALETEPFSWDERSEVIAATEELLRKRDDPSISALLHVFFDEGLIYRFAAHGGADMLLDTLRKHRDADATVQLVARYMAGEYQRHQDHSAYPKLLRVFVEAAPHVLPQDEVVEALIRLWNEKQYRSAKLANQARQAVVPALITVGSEAAFDAIDERLHEAPFNRAAIRALSGCRNDRAVDYLLYVLEETDAVMQRMGWPGQDEILLNADEVDKMKLRDMWAKLIQIQCLRALCGDPRLDEISEMQHVPGVEKMGVTEWSLGKVVYAKVEVTRLAPDLAVAGVESKVDEALSKLDAIIEERRERHKRGHGRNGE